MIQFSVECCAKQLSKYFKMVKTSNGMGKHWRQAWCFLTLHFTKSKLKNVFTTHLDLVVNAGKNVPTGKINDVLEVWFGGVVGRSNWNTNESPNNTEHNVKIFERKLALLKLQIQEPQSRHCRFGRYKDASGFLRSVAHTCWIPHRT